MNKRKLVLMLASVALIATVGVGATLAYFTDSTELFNKVETGYVDITISENRVTVNPETEEITREVIYDDNVSREGYALKFEDVMPGQTLDKDPTISLKNDSQTAYVRVKLIVDVPDGVEVDEDFAGQLDDLYDVIQSSMVASGNWAYNSVEEALYYQYIVDDETAANLFKTVTIPTGWDNSAANQTFNITIKAEGIQSEYLTDVLERDVSGKIIGWNGLPFDSVQEFVLAP